MKRLMLFLALMGFSVSGCHDTQNNSKKAGTKNEIEVFIKPDSRVIQAVNNRSMFCYKLDSTHGVVSYAVEKLGGDDDVLYANTSARDSIIWVGGKYVKDGKSFAALKTMYDLVFTNEYAKAHAESLLTQVEKTFLLLNQNFPPIHPEKMKKLARKNPITAQEYGREYYLLLEFGKWRKLGIEFDIEGDWENVACIFEDSLETNIERWQVMQDKNMDDPEWRFSVWAQHFSGEDFEEKWGTREYQILKVKTELKHLPEEQEVAIGKKIEECVSALVEQGELTAKMFEKLRQDILSTNRK